MRHRIIFGPTALALCASALIHSDSMIDNGIDDSAGAGGSPPKGDDHVMMGDNLILGGTGDKVKVGSDDILAAGDPENEGARDMILGNSDKVDDIGGTPARDQIPIGTFMVDGTGDTPDVAGNRLAA